MHDYREPVDQLLRRGEPSGGHWPDYTALGLRPAHVPELTRMATDPALNFADGGSREVWAPVHAWRALGQLRAADAAGPLLELLHRLAEAEDDRGPEEIPEVLAMIGPPALPALTQAVTDPANGLHVRWGAADGIAQMSKHHPEARPQCVETLARLLEKREDDDPVLNGVVVGNLLTLKAVEAAGVIEKAFADGRVDETVTGDWPRAQWELGLRDDQPPPRRFAPAMEEIAGGAGPSARSRTAKDRAKDRRKSAAKSRKRNRKK